MRVGGRCGRGASRRQHLAEHLILRSESGQLSAAEHGDLVNRRQRARAVRDHDRDAAALADAMNGARQGGFALGVEVGVGLVQHHQKR